jgi:hypothetical protein
VKPPDPAVPRLDAAVPARVRAGASNRLEF